MDFNAAIFDLDGTILDSMDVWGAYRYSVFEKREIFLSRKIM